MFSEAIANLSASGNWYERTGQGLQSRSEDEHTRFEASFGTLGKELVEAGPWVVDGKEREGPIHFFRRATAYSKFGGGTWSVSGSRVTLKLCNEMQLTFDSATHPTSFTLRRADGSTGTGRRDPTYAHAASEARADTSGAVVGGGAQSTTMERLLGHGPWAFGDAPISGGQSVFAFLRDGLVVTPSGVGHYKPIANADAVEMSYGGQTYRLSTEGVIGCYQAKAVRLNDDHPMRAWIMMRHVSMEYTGWRDAWGCKL